MYVDRTIQAALCRAGKFPVISINGPRQSGKTTLARHYFSDKPYATLENPETLSYATNDPKDFLGQYPDGAILDEVQRLPELFSWLQGIVDEPDFSGQFVLTGSQNFLLNESISQSLAGRVAVHVVLPFDRQEWPIQEDSKLDDVLLDGAYPRLLVDQLDRRQWYGSYVQTYLERDVRMLKDIGNISRFQQFLELCAGRVGQVLNKTNLASDLGITTPTVESWISVLESSYIAFRLRPAHYNIRKQIIKSPKLYFVDTGLAAYLLGIHSIDQLKPHPLRGQLFENYCVSESHKYCQHLQNSYRLCFYRDKSGNEVDMIAQQATSEIGIEIKSGQTVQPEMFKNLRYWEGLEPEKDRKCVLLYGGGDHQQRGDLSVMPWRNLLEILN